MGERRKKKYSESERESESESDSPSCSEESGGGGGRHRKERGVSSRAERKKGKRRRKGHGEAQEQGKEASKRSGGDWEEFEEGGGEKDSEFGSDSVGIEVGPEVVVEYMLAEFPGVVDDLKQAAHGRMFCSGISMEGDDELLGVPQGNCAPKRDDWMITLPPERNPNTMTMQSRSFSKASREGRGDTSVWTDTLLDRAQKAKLNYLEAYNEATAPASNEVEKKKMKTEVDLMEMYNNGKLSKSLVQKHREESSWKKKSKQKQPAEKEDWEGNHPWKPWDKEKDLTAGSQRVKFDAEQASEGLSSRFSSGSLERSFL